MSFTEFQDVSSPPERECDELLGSLLKAFPPTVLPTHQRAGYTYRPRSCVRATSYNPNFCAPGDVKQTPDQYAPERSAILGMVQSAFKCSTIGATIDDLREEAKSSIEFNLWRALDTELVAALALEAVNQNPLAIEGLCALSQAAQFLATEGNCGKGVIAGSLDWFTKLGSHHLTYTGQHYTDAVGNIVIPLSVETNTVYAFDSHVDIRLSDIQILDEPSPGIRRVNDMVVRAEQTFTLAYDACVIGSWDLISCCQCPTGTDSDPSTSTDDEVLCDDNGPFFRRVTDNGAATRVVSFVTVAGAPYVPVGPITMACPVGSVAEFVFCDGDVRFIRKFIQDENGTVLSVVDLDLGGAAYAVTGTVSACGQETVELGPVTLAALENITVQNPGGAGAVNIQDGGNSITVDGSLGRTWDLNFATDQVDASGSVVALDAATLAALESITVQNPGGAGAVNIQDGGNSITVDGTVTVLQGTSPWVVSGTVTSDTNFDYPEDSAHVSGDVGAFVLAVRNDAAAGLTTADGDYSPIATDVAGRVGITDLGGSITVDGSLGRTWDLNFATDQVDASGSVVALDAATLAALESITVQNPGGAGAVNIQDGGNSITVDGTVTADTNFDYPEDSAHVSGEVGAFVLAVRNDTAASRTTADGDYSPISTDAAGRVGISDLGGSITVDGTLAVTEITGTITNGAEIAVGAAAVSVLAANAARRKYIIQNTGLANIRVGVAGVTATTGLRLVPTGNMIIEMPNCPTQAIFAIREGAVDSIAFAQEVT